jgi:hypothetical protein
MSSSLSGFQHTTILRIKAVIGLAIANILLIHDKWAMFFYSAFFGTLL